MGWEDLTYAELRKEEEAEKLNSAVELIEEMVDKGFPYEKAFNEAIRKTYSRFNEECGYYIDSRLDEHWLDHLARESIRDNLEIVIPSVFERNRYERNH